VLCGAVAPVLVDLMSLVAVLTLLYAGGCYLVSLVILMGHMVKDCYVEYL
jgi:hypothetical protein